MTGDGGAHDRLFGYGGDDIMSVSAGTQGAFRGGDGDDEMTGAELDDHFRGNDGFDTIIGGDGIDTVGYQTASGSSAVVRGAFVNLSSDPDGVTMDFNIGTVDEPDVQSITVDAGEARDNWGATDTLSDIENVQGSAFADILIGSDGENRLEGLGDDDILSGGQENDTLIGGGGGDTYVWSAGDGDDTVLSSGSSGSEDIIRFQGAFYDYTWFIDEQDLIIGVTADDSYEFNTGGSLRLQDFMTGSDSIAYLEAIWAPTTSSTALGVGTR